MPTDSESPSTLLASARSVPLFFYKKDYGYPNPWMILAEDENIVMEFEVSRDEQDSIAQVVIENRTMLIKVTHIEDTVDSS